MIARRDDDGKDPWLTTVSLDVEGVDEVEVRRALGLIVDPDHWVMVQSFPSLRFEYCHGSDLDGLVRVVSGMGSRMATYLGLNPLPGPLRSASTNEDVVSRRWILIDLDAVKRGADGSVLKVKQASTTADEKEAARVVTEKVRDFLTGEGWPDPLYVDSGNNWQLLYRIDLPNDDPSREIVAGCIRSLGSRFDTPEVKIDPVVVDARRICKVPGTMVRKGPNTPERPWRMSRIISIPGELSPVPVGLLKSLAGISKKGRNAKPPAPVSDPWRLLVGRSSAASWARAALVAELAKIASCTDFRNNTFYLSCCKVGQVVAAGGIPHAEARALLTEAGVACGLGTDGDPKEIERALNNGFGWGIANPREPKSDPPGKAAKAPLEGPPLPDDAIVVRASSVVPRKVNWLWRDRIPRGFITMFAGRTGLGKSFVTCDVAARVSVGGSWADSDGECVPVGNVLFISEDPHDFVLTPRLIELGADMDRIFFMTWEAMARYTLSDVEMLARAAGLSEDPVLIVIDPPTNFLGAADEHKNVEVRRVLMLLVAWLDSLDDAPAIVLITHVNKGGNGVDAIGRVIGSVAWMSTARIGHAFTTHPEQPDQAIFVPLKNNLGPLAKGLAYRIARTEAFARVEWLGVADMSADDAMSGECKKKSRGVVATEWLLDQFRVKREWESDELVTAAREHGISRNALFAPEVMGLPIRKSRNTRADGTRYWSWTAMPGWPPEDTVPGGENELELLEQLEQLTLNPLQDNTHLRVPMNIPGWNCGTDRDSTVATGLESQSPEKGGQSPDDRDSCKPFSDNNLGCNSSKSSNSSNGLEGRDSSPPDLTHRAIEVLVAMLNSRPTEVRRALDIAAELGIERRFVDRAAEILKVRTTNADGVDFWDLDRSVI